MMRKVYNYLKTAALWMALTAMVLGGTSQLWNVVQDRQIDTVETQADTDRLEAELIACESVNKVRAEARQLAIDLKVSPESLKFVNERFADLDCSEKLTDN